MSTILPADFFGLHGLGSAARGIAGGIEQDRELETLRQQRAIDDAQRQLQLAMTFWGKDSPQVQQILELQGQKLLPGVNMAGAKPVMSSQELLDRELVRDIESVRSGTATPEQTARVNQRQTGKFTGAAGGMQAENLDIEGLKAGVEATKAGTAATEVGIKTATYDLEQKKAFNDTINALRNHPRFAKDLEGVPEGGVLGYFTLAELQQGLQKGGAEMSLINANIRAANAQAAKYIAEAKEAGRTALPGAKEWFERYAATSSLRPDLVAKGFFANDTLTPDERVQFETDYGNFITLTQAEMSRRIADAQASGDPALKTVIDLVSTEQAARAKGSATMPDDQFKALQTRLYNAIAPGSAAFKPGEARSFWSGGDIPPQIDIMGRVLSGEATATIAQQLGTASPGETQSGTGQIGLLLPPEEVTVTAQSMIAGGLEFNAEREALLGPDNVTAVKAEIARLKGVESPVAPLPGVQNSRDGIQEQKPTSDVSQMGARELVPHIDTLKSEVARIKTELDGEISVKQANVLFKERDKINKELRKAQDRFYQVSREEAATRAGGSDFVLPTNTTAGFVAPQTGASGLSQQPIPEVINQRGVAAAESTGATVGSGTPIRQVPSMFQPQPFGLPGEVLPRDPTTGQVSQDSIMKDIVSLTRQADAAPNNKALRERLKFLREQLKLARGGR